MMLIVIIKVIKLQLTYLYMQGLIIAYLQSKKQNNS